MDSAPLAVTTYVCSACGEPSRFDGIGGEWCGKCRTSEHLKAEHRLYSLSCVLYEDHVE